MATAKVLPLPPDYVRPTLAEFKAAGITHVGYEEYFTRHENELRKHYVAPIAALEAGEQIDWCEPANAEFVAGFDDNPNPEADHEDS